MIRSPAQPSSLRSSLLVLSVSLASLLVGAGGASLSPVTSMMFGPFCGLTALIWIAANSVRTGKTIHKSITLAVSAAILCGPFGAIVTMIVR